MEYKKNTEISDEQKLQVDEKSKRIKKLEDKIDHLDG